MNREKWLSENWHHRMPDGKLVYCSYDQGERRRGGEIRVPYPGQTPIGES